MYHKGGGISSKVYQILRQAWLAAPETLEGRCMQRPSPNQIYLTRLIKVLINEQLYSWLHCHGLTRQATFLTDQGYPAAGEGAVEILNSKEELTINTGLEMVAKHL